MNREVLGREELDLVSLSIMIIGLVAFWAVVGTMALTVAFALPTQVMRATASAWSEEFGKEDYHPYVTGTRGSQLDIFTDALMVNTAISSGGGDARRSLEDAMSASHGMLGDQNDPGADLAASLSGPVERQQPYARYWHGYLPALKVMLAVGITPQMWAAMNCGIQGLLLLGIVLGFIKRGRPLVSVAFVVFLISANIWSVVLSFQYSGVFLIAEVVTLVMLVRLPSARTACMLLACSGCAAAYVDLLTVPLVACVLPASAYIACGPRGYGAPQRVRVTIVLLASFFIAYAGMWASKWAIASCVLGENVFAESFEKMAFRSSSSYTSSTGSIVEFGYSDVLRALLAQFVSPAGLLAIGVAVIALIDWIRTIIVTGAEGDSPRLLPGILPWMILALVPLLWVAVLKNHTYIHVWMTYRLLCLVLFVFLCAIFDFRSAYREIVSQEKKQDERKSHTN